MSFSANTKEELAKHIGASRHCQIAELAAIFSICGQIYQRESQELCILMHTENEYVARKYFTLLKKTFNIDTEISTKQSPLHKNNGYTVIIDSQKDGVRILQALKLLNADNQIVMPSALVSPIVVQRSCCKRAFMRGVFLAAGSISDPQKFYHFEIVCTTLVKAEQLQEIIRSFGIDAKIVGRKRYFVVYIKEGSQIVEILGIMGAGISLMDLENVRILKEMRNSVNRKVNCETANINKTVSAAVKQIEDIKYIQNTIGFEELPEILKETANLRLEYPEATLKELGMLLSPAIGKSGINHRLRKLCSIAEELKGYKEEQL